MKKILPTFSIAFLTSTLLSSSLFYGLNTALDASQTNSSPANPSDPSEARIKRAIVALNPTRGNTATGIAHFIEVDGGIRVVATLDNLSPGKHGFHIHEFGDCSAPDASSAGGHFNPTHQKHGGPDHFERHAGDLGNIVANEKSRARYDRVDAVISLNGPRSIIGKSLIVSAKADDFSTQPSGDAGGAVACGVIVVQ
jgi:Cu-Zn family superoxide dismutase